MNEPINPYASPQSLSPEPPVAVVPNEINAASRGLRFANYLIDMIALQIISFLLGIVIALIWGEQGVEFMERGPGLMYGIFLSLLYFIGLEATTSQTFGKMLTGTKVVNEAGQRPTFGQFSARALGRFIPFEPLSFFGTPPRGWHDRLSKTWVVKCR